MNREIADRLLKETRENYDSIAESFSQTRNYVWPDIKSLVGDYSKAGQRILDIGCGNGRYYPAFKEKGTAYVGIDNSRNLIAIAKNKFPGAEFMVADALSLPFGESEFDLAVSVAVLHHIPSKDYRRVFFDEAYRVLKPGGWLIVTAWDLRPLSMAKAKRWRWLKSFIRGQLMIVAGSKLDFGDFFIPWQNRCQRYIHSFSLGELKKFAASSGFRTIASGAKEGNLYIVAKKCEKDNGA